MPIIRAVPISPCSNQLHRLLSRFPGGRSPRLLQFRQMDSLMISSANSHIGALIVNSHNRDLSSDMIMVGEIPVYLNRKRYEEKSSSPWSVNKCDDDSELGRERKMTPANVSNSYRDDEFQPVSRQITKRRSRIDLELERSNNTSSFIVKGSPLLDNNGKQDESSLPLQLGKKNEPFCNQKRQSMDIGSKNCVVMDNLHPFEPFDICSYERRGNAKPGALWQFKGMEPVAEATNYSRVLRPGMVLLKHYMTLHEQVNIVKTCQELGVGPGGFYRPGYKDGAKLRLQMMCLGLDWDPQTRKYGDKRAVDGDKPPEIPPKFAMLVTEALEDAHALIKNKCNKSNVESILPSMSPDICIVNFYTTSGRLGLHQDRDESKESLASELPVVSFSLGDSAEFLYGDRRDVDKAEKVVLESGDVLIFGGESRHVFHGVSSIIPNSTPQFLLDHTGLRPGRLNLTFRKY